MAAASPLDGGHDLGVDLPASLGLHQPSCRLRPVSLHVNLLRGDDTPRYQNPFLNFLKVHLNSCLPPPLKGVTFVVDFVKYVSIPTNKQKNRNTHPTGVAEN